MDKLFELERIRKEKEEALNRYRESVKPQLNDISLIPELYIILRKISEERVGFPGGNRGRQRFLFIIILLYSPGTLFGDLLIRGVRDVLAKVFEVSPQSISNSLQTVWFLYRTYKDFRDDVDYLYAAILMKIEFHGLK